MADMNIRDVPPESLSSWKKSAIDAGMTLREWVIKKLGGSLPKVEPPKSPTVGPIEVKPATLSGGKPEVKGLPRHFADFVKQFHRQPENQAEFDSFVKRGW